MLFVLGLPGLAAAQNTNSSTTVRPRTASPGGQNTNRSTTDAEPTPDDAKVRNPCPGKKGSTRAGRNPNPYVPEDPGSQSVAAAFNALINGIRKSDVNADHWAYWNSPRLTLVQQQRYRD